MSHDLKPLNTRSNIFRAGLMPFEAKAGMSNQRASFHAFRNASDPRDVVITDRRQNAPLPTGVRWAYYATFASPLKAAVAFGVGDIRQLRQHVHSHGYQRVRIERILRRA